MRLCSGCQTKVPDGRDAPLCDACKAERNKPVADDGIRSNVAVRYDGAYDAALDKQNKSLRWQKRRLVILRRDPMCKLCDKAVSVLVDHIVPAYFAVEQARLTGRWPLDPWLGYYMETNLQGLCRKCHGVKTDEDKKHVGSWPDVIGPYDQRPRKVWSF